MTLETIDEVIKQAEADSVDPRLIQVAQKYRKDMYISSTLEQLNEHLEMFKVEELKELYEKVQEEKIIVEEEVQANIEDLLLKVEENPNYIQEK